MSWGKRLKVWGGQETKNHKTECQRIVQKSHTHAQSTLQQSTEQHKYVRKLPRPEKSPRKGAAETIPRHYKVLGNVLAFTVHTGQLHNKLGIK